MRLIPTVGDYLPLIVGAFVVAALLSLVLTPLVRRVAIRLDNIDHPEERRVNKAPIPRGGGVAVAAAFLLTSVGGLLLNSQTGQVPFPRNLDISELAALLLGGLLATVLGVLDDTFQLRARWQLLGQLVLAVLAVGFGVAVTFVNNPFGPSVIPLTGPFAIGFTMLWVVGMVNSINFIDGLDGLSTGITFIAAMTLGVISLFVSTPREPLVALFCLILAGALLGFLKWNFNPASIFTGTSGIMFVGYVLSVLAVMGAGKVAVAALVLGVPIMDTFWIIVRRTAARRSPFSPDRNHIHHRLLDLGLSHRGTVMLIYCVCLLLAVLSLVLSNASQLYAFMGLILLFGLALYLIERLGGGATAIDESLDADTYDTDATSGNGAEAK